MKKTATVIVISFIAAFVAAQSRVPSSGLIRIQSALVALEHVLVIDGTGSDPRPDQTILIAGDKISAVGDARSVAIPNGALRLDLGGYTAIPGLVGMHDHLFYAGDLVHAEQRLAHDLPFSFPRLFLASGVTTIRTAGSFEPYTDLEIKKAVDAGTLLGPKMNVTGPYLEGSPFALLQIHKLTGPDDARRTVDYWAAEGAGSFKVYTDITRAELRAAIDAAHRHGLTITGHLCSIGFREAAEMGIDSLEHGLFVDTEFASNKKPDICPDPANASASEIDIHGAPVQNMIRTLVAHHVAVTSTLPVLEEYLAPRSGSYAQPFLATRPDPAPRVLDVLSPSARNECSHGRDADTSAAAGGPESTGGRAFQRYAKMFRKEMEFEKVFSDAGGLLMAGSDAVVCADIAGFGDQREIELLVEAGFTPVQAIHIATWNGAAFLKATSRIGSIAPGKQADMVILHGDLSKDIHHIENVEIVFKDGIGYDSKKIIDSLRGLVGIR